MRRTSFVSLATSLLVLSTSVLAQERAIAIRGGKIVAVGANAQVPAGAEVVDAAGKYVMPGVIDAVSHIGLDANDLNEPTDPMTPQNRAWEAYNPFGTFGSGQVAPLRNKEALSGGVTTQYIAPADAQLLG